MKSRKKSPLYVPEPEPDFSAVASAAGVELLMLESCDWTPRELYDNKQVWIDYFSYFGWVVMGGPEYFDRDVVCALADYAHKAGCKIYLRRSLDPGGLWNCLCHEYPEPRGS